MATKTPTVADRVRLASIPQRQQCSVLLWLETLHQPARHEWIAAFDADLPMSAVWRVMAEDGFAGSRSACERHIKRQCSCRLTT